MLESDRSTEEERVKSDGFARSLLEAVVVRNTLRISEVELFKAVIQRNRKSRV